MKAPSAILFLLLAISAHADSRTATTAERTACEAPLLQRLDAIEVRLRRGYDVAEGKRLKKQQRELQLKRLGCRRYPPGD